MAYIPAGITVDIGRERIYGWASPGATVTITRQSDGAYGAPTGAVAEEEQALRRGLSRADTLSGQGRREEAVEVLLQLRSHFPASAPVAQRLESLGWSPEAPAGEEGEFVDLQAEVLEGFDLRLGSEFAGFAEFEVSELDDIVIVRRTADLAGLDVAPFARALVAYVLG